MKNHFALIFLTAATLLASSAWSAPPTQTPLDPSSASQELKNGNARYMLETPNACTDARSDRSQLVQSQAPDAIIAASLSQQSKIIHDAIISGQVRIERAIYDLDTGQVEFWT